jgi:iron(III) transport system ATP-binding protein
MTTISLDALGKSFAERPAVDRVSLTFPSGSFTALLGPSGCGKTTLLRLIAGFEQPDRGRVSFDGTIVAQSDASTPPERRNLGVVFQSYALWPHMDVAANVAYPLKQRGLSRSEVEARVASALAMVSLTGYGDRQVDQLSGGQRQRVALARCLVTGTRIILLDEPLANLDVHLRGAMLDVFADIHRTTGATIIFVTHDQHEALAVADTIVVMEAGTVQQIGTPETIYSEPANAMVASFVGRGALLAASVAEGQAELAGYRFSARGPATSPQSQVLLRPHAIRIAESGLAATVERATYHGAGYETALRLITGDVLLADLPRRFDAGAAIKVAIDDSWIVPA